MMTDEETSGKQELILPEKPKVEDEPPSAEVAQFHELMEIERARIDSANKRTEVVQAMIASQTAQSIREHDYALRKMDSDDASEKRRLSVFRTVVYVAGGFVLVVVAFLLYIVFYSKSEHADMASAWLTNIASAIGGGSFLVILGGLLKSVLNKRT